MFAGSAILIFLFPHFFSGFHLHLRWFEHLNCNTPYHRHFSAYCAKKLLTHADHQTRQLGMPSARQRWSCSPPHSHTRTPKSSSMLAVPVLHRLAFGRPVLQPCGLGTHAGLRQKSTCLVPFDASTKTPKLLPALLYRFTAACPAYHCVSVACSVETVWPRIFSLTPPHLRTATENSTPVGLVVANHGCLRLHPNLRSESDTPPHWNCLT